MTTFLRPSAILEGDRDSIKETFENFYNLSVIVNTALLELLFNEKDVAFKDYKKS